MIPYDPKTIEEHKRRYPKAVSKIYHAEDIDRGAQTPGQCPDNVFDFSDGLKLIISRDVLHDSPKPIIHVSASLKPGTLLWDLIRQGKSLAEGRDCLLRVAELRFEVLSGGLAVEFVGFSPVKGVPHWREIK
jgi:hypothetical protein